MIYKSLLEKKYFYNKEICSLEFKSLSDCFIYSSGSYLSISFIDDTKSNFSQYLFPIHSAPENDLIKITFEINNDFKKELSKSDIGKLFKIKIINGDFFSKPHVTADCIFIAKGLGVTPILSLFLSSNFRVYKNPILFLILKNESYIFLESELLNSFKINNSLEANIFYESQDDVFKIKNNIQSIKKKSMVFISGNNSFIQETVNDLLKFEIKKHYIRTNIL